MKAAVVYDKEEMPHYADFPDPQIIHEHDVLITMKAAALKNFDKSRASGRHYSVTDTNEHGKVIGSDGVGLLVNGTRVFAFGNRGMIAEKAVVRRNSMLIVPEAIDDATAAALPNAVAGSAMALRFKAEMKTGETVLINGATGFTGKIAVQIAKHYGAKKIIVTGRNKETLQQLLHLGADEVLLLGQSDIALSTQLIAIHKSTPIDIVIDYLWGHTAEIILSTFMGNGSLTNSIRYVSVGAVTGDKIQLSAENLRSVDLHLSGSGLGSWSKDEMQLLFSEIIPSMFQLTVEGRLKVDTMSIRLSDISTLWNVDPTPGTRLVITM